MELKKFNLENSVAFITGGAGFLGLQHAEALLKSGARVVLADISDKDLIKSTNYLKHKYKSKKVNKVICDVTSINSIKEVQKALEKDNLFIDILINNAAIDPKVSSENNIKSSSRLENFDISDWDMQIAVGLTGAFNCIKVFGNAMANSSRNCVILNIASDLSVIAPDQRIYRKEGVEELLQQVKPVTYSVIKSGLVGLTKYVATYWANKGVRCNALSPGGIYNKQPESFVSKLNHLIPMQRMANIDEYHGAVQFLCSDASSYMTGQNIIVDGGRTVW